MYTWERMDCREHLFLKNISDHSIRALKELYREVGKSFEAVGNEKSYVHQTSGITLSHCPTGGASFHSRINQLQSRLTIQMTELRQWQNKANSESELRQQTETKAAELERMVQTVVDDNQRLERHVQDWKLVAERCESRKIQLEQAVGKILVCLNEIKPKPNR